MVVNDPTTLITCKNCEETITIAYHVHIQAYGRNWLKEEKKERQELEENGWGLEVDDFVQNHYCPRCGGSE